MREDIGLIEGFSAGFRPGHVELPNGILGLPIAIRDDGYETALVEHFDNARQVARISIVDRHRLGTKDRRSHDGGIFHVRQVDIDAEFGRAVCLGRNIKPRQRLAHQRVLVRRLQRRLRGRGIFACLYGKTGIGFGSSAGLMVDIAVRRAQFARRHIPALGSGLDDHFPRRGASDPHAAHAGKSDRRATARNLQPHGLGNPQETAIQRILDKARDFRVAHQEFPPERVIGIGLMRRRLFKRHRLPVGIHFIGQHLRHRRENALAHFTVRDDRGNRIIGGQLDPDIDQRFAIFGHHFCQLRGAMTFAYSDADH